MRKHIRTSFIVLLVMTLIVMLIGCSNEGDVLDGEVEGYNDFIKEIDQVAEILSVTVTNNPLLQKLKEAEPEVRSELAMQLADDMAIATTFGLINEEILAISGEAVKAYPHPLLINNYATMLYAAGSNEEALYFFEMALNQEPDNPILLTNIANLYLEQEDYAAAKDYATRALQTMNDYGPAYQVLTTVHLQEDNPILAAEMMVKSAKYAFNEVSIYHFDSFLAAVDVLDPTVDEYPLNEVFIDELYEIARTNVDTLDINTTIDTPTAQIKLQPFPTIGSADHLEQMEDYLRGESMKLRGLWDVAHNQSITIGNVYSNYLHIEESTPNKIPIQKNLRQYYAYKVLESYYQFKLDQLSEKLEDQAQQWSREANEQIRKWEHEVEEKEEQLSVELDEATKQMFADTFSGKQPDIAKVESLQVQIAQLGVDKEQGIYDIQKRYANELIQASQQTYNASKQLIEEFWLKSGGLMKYIIIEEVFDYVNIQREMLVYHKLHVPFELLADYATKMHMQKFDIFYAKQLLNVALKNQAVSIVEESEEKIVGDDLTPQIEKEALATYPEAYDTGDVFVEHEVFGHSLSLSYNGDTLDISVDTLIFGGGGLQWSMSSPDQYKIYTLHDVKMTGSTGWFKDTSIVENALKKPDIVNQTIGKLGTIGIGYTNHVRTGQYITRSWGGTVIDRGTIYVREQGGEIGELGKTEKVEVIRSQMTGVAEKKTATKYKFKFAGFSTAR